MVTVSAAQFASSIAKISSTEALHIALAEACESFGIQYFALSHHVDFTSAPQALRVHNYPDGWEEWYDANRFGLTDPIHRASHFTARGFYWHDVPDLIPMTRADQRLLGRGKEIGLGEGVTVPAHVPGEARGSCSFVAAAGRALPEDALIWAQAIGTLAFEGARRLQRRTGSRPTARLSERQRQCVALAGRGHTDRSIALMLGIGVQSVMEHMREARARLGVSTRTQLVVSLLDTGHLCLDDVKPQFR